MTRHLVLSKGTHHLLELGRDEVEALYTEFKLVECALNHAHEMIVTLYLLHQDDVEGVRVTPRQLVLECREVDDFLREGSTESLNLRNSLALSAFSRSRTARLQR